MCEFRCILELAQQAWLLVFDTKFLHKSRCFPTNQHSPNFNKCHVALSLRTRTDPRRLALIYVLSADYIRGLIKQEKNGSGDVLWMEASTRKLVSESASESNKITENFSKRIVYPPASCVDYSAFIGPVRKHSLQT